VNRLGEHRAIHGKALSRAGTFRITNNKAAKLAPFVISHKSQFKTAWDILQAIILVFLAVDVPIRVGFSWEATGAAYVLACLLDVYFWIDIVLNFLFTFERSDETIGTTLKDIRKEYFRTWFLVDFLASLPVDLAEKCISGTFRCSLQGTCTATSNDAGLLRMFKLLRFVKLIKLVRLVRIQRLLNNYEAELFQYMQCLNIMKLGLVILFLGHLMGCFFFFFSVEEWRTETERDLIHDGKTEGVCWSRRDSTCMPVWQDTCFPNGLENHSVLDKYIASAYWAFTTITTVGYGDISARTISERAFAIISMVVGGFTFSALVGLTGSLLQQRDLSKLAAERKMNLVNAFVKDGNLPRELRKRILNFFRRQEVRAYDETALLKELPYEERLDAHMFCSGRALRSMPVFSDCDEVFFVSLLQLTEPIAVPTGVALLYAGDHHNAMYILKEGAVTVTASASGAQHDTVQVAKLDAPSFFGEGEVVGEDSLQLSVIALTFVRVLKMNKLGLMSLLERHPNVRNNLRRVWLQRPFNHPPPASPRGAARAKLINNRNLDNKCNWTAVLARLAAESEQRHRCLDKMEQQLGRAISAYTTPKAPIEALG
jgi:hypothetical protein